MDKQAQYSSVKMAPMVRGKTLQDLYIAIRADAGLPTTEKAQVIGQIKGMTQWANESTPLSALLHKGLGGMIGWLIAKYFGMGPLGQLVSAVAGYGIGNTIHKQLNKPTGSMPGWKIY